MKDATNTEAARVLNFMLLSLRITGWNAQPLIAQRATSSRDATTTRATCKKKFRKLYESRVAFAPVRRSLEFRWPDVVLMEARMKRMFVAVAALALGAGPASQPLIHTATN